MAVRSEKQFAEKMSKRCLLRLLRQNCGAELDILATSKSFRHLFDNFFLTHWVCPLIPSTAPPLVSQRPSPDGVWL